MRPAKEDVTRIWITQTRMPPRYRHLPRSQEARILEIDPRGSARLSMRVVDQETGAELEETRLAREPRSDRGDGGGEPRGDRAPRREGGDEGPAPEFAPAFLTRDDG